MISLVVGYGEVGKSLGKVLGKHCYLDLKKSNWKDQIINVVHICIPYSENFEREVKYWSGRKLVIVHSTVPVGTCDRLGVVHSPIAGVHPHLEQGIRTFVKYFGGTNEKDVRRAANIFSQLGIKTKTFKNARTTEAMKLFSTTQYGLLIMLQKEMYKFCKENDLDFEAIYTESNKDYNKGYIELGMPQVVRPYLKYMEGEIAGHCIIPNAKLLKDFWLSRLLLKQNATYKNLNLSSLPIKTKKVSNRSKKGR